VKKLNIALVGLGNVGSGVYQILTKEIDLINLRCKNKIELVAVSARSKKDFIDQAKVKFYDNPLDLAEEKAIDIIIEVITEEKTAYDLLSKAIKNGKKYISANKALLTNRGFEIAGLVEEYNGHIAFEAAVGAAIPIVKSFKEGLAANKIQEFYAILNGTCNYILSKMSAENLDFDSALKQAQDLGYAEFDPTFDIEGIDTAHKLTILAAIAGNFKPHFDNIYIEGITTINISDIKMAFELGYKIKLLAIYKNLDQNSTFQAVYPTLIPITKKIATIDDSYNAILTYGNNCDWNFHVGRGAGRLPTASAIIADVIDMANDRFTYTFNCKADLLEDAKIIAINDRHGKYFLKLSLDYKLSKDNNSVAKLFLGGSKINIETSFFTSNKNGTEIIFGAIITAIKESDLIAEIAKFDQNLVKSSKFIRVEETGGF
jgi:homoserine dehydrogenase